jgi:hypothetical protein
MADETPKNEITKPVPQAPPIAMGERGIRLATYEDAFRFAKSVLASRLAPDSFKSPESVLVAMQYGLELGMTPMKSLQSIAVVNGKPTLWGDAALGMVKASGLCEYVKEWVDGDGEQMIAHVVSKRKSEPEPVETTFSVKDAKDAGLWGKTGPWKQYPKRMLKYRARAFNLRDNFPDVLGGMHLQEEIEPDPEPAYQVRTPTREQRRAGMNVVNNDSQPETNATDANFEPESQTSSSSPTTPADKATIETMVKGLLAAFLEKLPVTLEGEAIYTHFCDYCAFVCGGSKDNYRDPNTFTMERCSQIKEAIETGIDAGFLETIPGAVNPKE